ncbi:MAG: TlpA family protein disulfide reductase [Candidatus Hydrogenedentota bacterium]|nr:MAG: TlpA family protein disulfide reductase [Candidatus Hydrogenedentota bacterium]
MQEFPVLDKVSKKFAAERLAVLTINGDRSKKAIKRVLDKVDTSIPVLRDRKSEVFKAYNAFAIPTLYLIDQQGKIYAAWTGAVEDLETRLGDSVAFMVKHHGVIEIAEAVSPAPASPSVE